MRKNSYLVLSAIMLMMTSCGGRIGTTTEADIDPRDTVTVPEYLHGEDSIAYIEDVVVQSPISAEDLLGLAEVHWYDRCLSHYNNRDMVEEYPEYASCYIPTHRDVAAMQLANRFSRMHDLVNSNGDANDKLQWAVAVNAVLDTFRVAVPWLSPDSTLEEIGRVVDEFSSQTQLEMNTTAWILATVEYYKTVEAYRHWLMDVPASLRPLAQEEYEAWHDLNEARFKFWNHVSYTCIGYSMRTMEVATYYSTLAENRRAELAVERDIVLRGKPYSQKGKTVTTQQWEEWIAEKSVPEDYEFLEENDTRMPSDSLVACRVSGVRTTFARWLAARQAIAAALPEEQGKSYDNLTADIHSRFIGTLDLIIPFDPW